jgi:hypothetical protein
MADDKYISNETVVFGLGGNDFRIDTTYKPGGEFEEFGFLFDDENYFDMEDNEIFSLE